MVSSVGIKVKQINDAWLPEVMLVNENIFENARGAVLAFFPDRDILGLEVLGGGHINDSFLVSLTGDSDDKFVLQRLNRQVFPQPELIMANLRVLADHLEHRLQVAGHKCFDGWQVVRPIIAAAGRYYFVDSGDNFWRMLSYVGGATNFDRVQDSNHAKEAGRALGLFHQLVSDLDPELLEDTLPAFHVTPAYLADYDRVFKSSLRQLCSVDEEYCARIIEDHRSCVAVLEDAARQGILPTKVIHGDPRVANIMYDERCGRAVSLVDLDTVKPGLLHYDIGDCLRSCCNPAGDRVEKIDNVRFDPQICRNLLGGYLAEMAPLLTDVDYEFIYPAVRIITFELGLRFFTDHLAGDMYFKVSHNGHNLQRAMIQFRLLESIEGSESLICNIVERCRQDIESARDIQ